ncbi:conserved hypothetical protein [Vibrio chagasii]|nr:conserved hypothetical protein [Vibrio chagasii]CAH7353041.1 conserved hypothetical protein [Vibrio chagasii]CAH7385325.1 conserved hypothetical protein [Vibrio chagasii]
MSVVYITESNFSKIAHEVGDAISSVESLESLYDFDFRCLLATPELKRLSSIKLILESMSNPDVFFKLLEFNKTCPDLRSRRSSKDRWIFLGGSPAYHRVNTCTRLKSEYHNYGIPVEIPEARIEEYRSFFMEKLPLFERDQAAFYANVEMKFNVRIANVHKVHAKNSGVEEVDNCHYQSPHEALIAISKHIEMMLNFKNKSEVTSKTIDKCGFNTQKSLKNPGFLRLTGEQIEIVQVWHEYKSHLKRLVIKHLTMKLNPDFSFEGELLDSFGFRQCAECFKKHS